MLYKGISLSLKGFEYKKIHMSEKGDSSMMTARTYNIWENMFENEPIMDTVGVVWSGLFSCAMESKEMLGGILPSDMPLIFPNHRGHGYPEDFSDGVISFDGVIEDIKTVSDFTREMRYRKLLHIFNSVSCPPGFVYLINSESEIIKQDASVFISPPDNVYKHMPLPFKLGSFATRNDYVPNFVANGCLKLLRYVATHRHEQIDDDARMRFMNIKYNPAGILSGLKGFPHISEKYKEIDNRLKQHPTMVIYGTNDEIVPQEDILNFIRTLKRAGADVAEIPIYSGHRITGVDSDNPTQIAARVDENKIDILSGDVYEWFDKNNILEPPEKEDLISMEEQIERYSNSKTKPYCFFPEGCTEGGALLRITRDPDNFLSSYT